MLKCRIPKGHLVFVAVASSLVQFSNLLYAWFVNLWKFCPANKKNSQIIMNIFNMLIKANRQTVLCAEYKLWNVTVRPIILLNSVSPFINNYKSILHYLVNAVSILGCKITPMHSYMALYALGLAFAVCRLFIIYRVYEYTDFQRQ